MSKDIVMYNKILTPEAYLAMMTGKIFYTNVDNQLEFIEKTLDREFGEGSYWSYPLEEIDKIVITKKKVVLVEIVNIIIKDNKAEQEKLYRWFEVPDEWTKNEITNKLIAHSY